MFVANNVSFVPARLQSNRRKNTLSDSKSSGKGEPLPENRYRGGRNGGFEFATRRVSKALIIAN